MTVREGIHVIALSYFVWDLTKDRDSFQEKIERIERLEAEYEALVKERERFEELHKKL
jgi:flagellar motility protein MotE (MotC chaperone)